MEVKKKKKSRFCYLNPRNLETEVHRYGYNFSLGTFWKWFVLGLTGMVGLCLLYQLQLPFMLTVILCGLYLAPFIILNVYKGMYEQKRFIDVSNYMEQMLYSFRRHPKILDALNDTLMMFGEGSQVMREQILKARDNLLNKPVEDGNIYRKAFAELEEQYDCRRLKTIHNFLIRVEENGGHYTTSIDLLSEERRLWVERVYELQKERKSLNVKIVISLLLCFAVCFTTMLMLPKDFGTLDTVLCQTGATALILFNMLLWYQAQKKLSPNWLDDTIEDKARIGRAYKKVVERDKKKERTQRILKLAFSGVVIMGGAILSNTTLLVLGLMAVVFSVLQSGFQQKNARKFICREADKAFPIWMMELSLYLQTENPRVALAKCAEHAPYIFAEDLKKLVKEIEWNPTNIEPYLNFMPAFDLPDVKSALKLLYSLSELGTQEMEGQLSALADRNNRLMDKAERLENEDKLAGTGLLVLLPMLTGSFKMMVDLGVFLVSLLSMTKDI